MCPEIDSASESEYQDLFWVKGGRCFWLTTYHPCSAETSRKSGTLTYPKPLGQIRPVAGHIYFFLQRIKEERNVLPAIKQRNANWIGHILRRNCLLKHVIKGKTEGTRSEKEDVSSY